MKFLAIASIAIVAAQDDSTAEPAACAEGECNVTDSETGETTCTAQADVDAS